MFYKQEFTSNFFSEMLGAYDDKTGLANIDDITIDDVLFYSDKNTNKIQNEFFISIFYLDPLIGNI